MFHLEHDFAFERPVDVRDLRAVLDDDVPMAQCALVRQPVNGAEVAAGGLLQSRPGAWRPRDCWVGNPPRHVHWLEHEEWFTTNPSLIPTSVLAAHPLVVEDECEGRYGLRLRSLGRRFAYLGRLDDPPAVRHIGARTGTGY